MKYTTQVALGSLYIASVMYVAAIAMAFENILVFYAGIVSSIWLAIDYGALLSGSGQAAAAEFGLPAWMMLIFGCVQAFKCYDVHIIQGQNFIYFPRIN